MDLNEYLKGKRYEGKVKSAKKGYFQGGNIPIGYKKFYSEDDKKVVLIKDENESFIVKRIFTEYARIKSMNKVALALNEQGILTKDGNLWSRAAVGFILSNEFYLGKLKYGDVKAKGNHEPIISRKLFDKVKKIKQQNRRNIS